MLRAINFPKSVPSSVNSIGPGSPTISVQVSDIVPRLANPPALALDVVTLAPDTHRQIVEFNLLLIPIDWLGGAENGALFFVKNKEYSASLGSTHIGGVCQVPLILSLGVQAVQYGSTNS